MIDILPSIEIETAAQPTHAVIWLHGLGASGEDFVPVVEGLGLPKSMAVRFVFPQAPDRPVTVNAGYIMPAWYDILSLSEVGREIDMQGVLTSQQQINHLIQREITRGIPSHRIVIAGFSQGGAMAYSVGLTYPERLAGVMALSAYIPALDWLEQNQHAANQLVPVLINHGTQDNVVPLQLGRQAASWLQARGYTVLWREYAMAHQLCVPQIRQIGVWLREVLQAEHGKF